MTLFRLLLAATLVGSVSMTAMAQDQVPDDEETIEELPNRKLERRGTRIRGPITSVGAGAMLFASFDTNSDYKINEVEFAAGRTEAFNIADKDNSNSISLFELEDWRKAALGSLDAAPGNLAFDKDYDQRVTREEFDRALGFVFRAGDKNKDGILAFTELVNVFEMPRRTRGENGEGTNNRANRQGRQGRQGQQGRRGQQRRGF